MADSALLKIAFEALTYDDVLLLPAYSEVLPRNCDTGTRLTSNIRLQTPLISAAMDTVTESDMAIALAQEGGLGIIHKNMSIKAQADQVRRVKRSELKPRRLARHGHTRRQMQRQWLAATGAVPSPQMLWSRNSVFSRHGAPLRVMELFAPTLSQYSP